MKFPLAKVNAAIESKPAHERLLLELAPCCHTFRYRVVKRLIDIIASVAALVLFSPLLAAIAVGVELTSPGPAFYPWHVIGRNGMPFTGYKFRTMVVDADDLKHRLLSHNERHGPTFKMKGDPRVTRFGRVLRKFSLDELPQLWSVMKGDMSLVGPRPVGPQEWAQFKHWQRRKLSVTPGGICLSHVSGRPERFDEWIRLDLEYVDHWSLWLDLKIVISGVSYVLTGKNY